MNKHYVISIIGGIFMETRVCKQCGIEKPMICYKSEIKNGKKYYRWSCNECEKSKKSKYNKNTKRTTKKK